MSRQACKLHRDVVPFLKSHAFERSSSRLCRRTVSKKQIVGDCSRAVTIDTSSTALSDDISDQVRVRFAPSPTGNLHVGGARTALFNWLFAKNRDGKLILRVEDTDQNRSTPEAEAAVIRDLKWLGLHWDEGPDVEGDHGPYRQTERTQIYKRYVERLVEQNQAYPCFCTDEELERMREEAEAQKLPPIYKGKWAAASPEEVTEMINAGHPYCYRFRVPREQIVQIKDTIRGEVAWNTNTLGDFVVMRSNGMPVYNFCVTIDDALMKITHVIRAEEHLANTMKQVLIYRALNFPEPEFGHVSLILAPDKTKLSKRHGATSLNEFKEEGYLPMAMINYLSLLGWNDGTEQEIYTLEELQEKFSLDQMTKSAAVFDKSKLSWMNGQYIRALAFEEARTLFCGIWREAELLSNDASPFVDAAVEITQDGIERLSDAAGKLSGLFDYPLLETLQSEAAKIFLEDGISDVFRVVVESYEDGSLLQAIDDDTVGIQIKSVGKKLKRKGKRIFMPYRIAITGRLQGPEVMKILKLLRAEDGDICPSTTFVPLDDRMKILKDWIRTSS